MDNLLKTISCFMVIILFITQLLLATPYRDKLIDESMNGRPLKTYETLIYNGSVTINVFGSYAPNSAAILINGESKKIVDSFPTVLTIRDGDFIEIQLKQGNPSFYAYLAEVKGQIKTDIKESTLLIKPGINRIAKVLKSY